MLQPLADWLGIPVAAAGALLALVFIQLVLQVVGIVDLARRKDLDPRRRWTWLVVVALGALVGAVVYLAIGRSRLATDDGLPSREAGPTDRGRSEAALDRLYGEQDKP